MSVHKYIGETSRSAFARGLEHQNDARLMNKGSHILKHWFLFHDGENPAEMKMRMNNAPWHKYVCVDPGK